MVSQPEDEASRDSREQEPVRKLFSRIAKQHLSELGYTKVLQDFEDHYKGAGLGEELVRAIGGHISPDELEENFHRSLPGRMPKIISPQEVFNLLITAAFGKPVRQDGNQSVIVDYRVAEPYTSTIQAEFDPNRDSKHLIMLKSEGPKTAAFVGGIAFNTGFRGTYPDPAGLVKDLNKKLSLELRSTDDPTLVMQLSRPRNIPEVGKSPTSWAHHIRVLKAVQ